MGDLDTQAKLIGQLKRADTSGNGEFNQAYREQ